MKSLKGYKGKLHAGKYWHKQYHGMAFEVTFDNRKDSSCIGVGNIGVLFADGEEIVVTNSRQEFIKYGIPHEL